MKIFSSEILILSTIDPVSAEIFSLLIPMLTLYPLDPQNVTVPTDRDCTKRLS